jgi:hypothetical protein
MGYSGIRKNKYGAIPAIRSIWSQNSKRSRWGRYSLSGVHVVDPFASTGALVFEGRVTQCELLHVAGYAVIAAETDEVRVSRLLRAMSTLIVVSMAAPR